MGAAKAGLSAAAPLSVEDTVHIGAGQPYAAVTEGLDRSASERESEGDALPGVGYSQGIPLADAMARAEKEKRRYWIPLVLLAFLLIPLGSYYAGKKAPVPAGPPGSGLSRSAKRIGKAAAPAGSKITVAPAKPASDGSLSLALGAAVNAVPPVSATLATNTASTPAKEAPAPVKPEARAPANPEVKLAPKPEAKQMAKIEPNPAAKPAARPAANPAPVAETKPAAKAGMKSLPPMIANAKLDSSYGKNHPGWQRYADGKAEYTVFKEDDRFRALQVVALGKEALPNQLFRKLLKEFGGVDRYHLESAGEKGEYLMERGAAKGGLSLTIYKKKTDQKVKGLVLYYQ